MKKYAVLFIATACGSGYSPIASGTAGSLVALILAYFIMHASVTAQIIILVGCYFPFAWVAGEAEEIFGRPDAGEIVCDEVLGMWLTLFLIAPDVKHLAAGFVLFRLFDIVKPFPARWIDRNMGGGHGIMLDDVVAALYSQVCLRLIL